MCHLMRDPSHGLVTPTGPPSNTKALGSRFQTMNLRDRMQPSELFMLRVLTLIF